MKRIVFPLVIIPMLIAICVSCGDFYTYEPVRVELLSLENGDTLKKNDDVYFKIVVDDTDTSPQTCSITLKNSLGQVMASNTLQSPEINTELVLNDLINSNLQLPYGEYTLEFSLTSGQEILTKTECIFFYVDEDSRINGVWSYPWLIEPKDKALLIADLKTTDTQNPYIRWSQNDVVIAKGLLHDGFDQILWETPAKEGVYSISVEVFPFAPPKGRDFEFTSKTVMSAELYVSAPAKNPEQEKKKKKLFYSLFEIYLRSKEKIGTTNSTLVQTQLKKPKIVLNSDIIGFRLDGTRGFICDNFIIPIKNNLLQSFNLSVGIMPQGEQKSKTVFYLYSEAGTFAMRYFFNEKQVPTVTMTIEGVTHTFVSEIGPLTDGTRYVIDFSLVINDGTLKAVWRLDGKQVSAAENAYSAGRINNSGVSIIGGANGFTGIIDTLDVTLLEDNDIALLTASNGPMLAKRLK
jgi:hypothetical protein